MSIDENETRVHLCRTADILRLHWMWLLMWYTTVKALKYNYRWIWINQVKVIHSMYKTATV